MDIEKKENYPKKVEDTKDIASKYKLSAEEVNAIVDVLRIDADPLKTYNNNLK